MKHGHRFTLAAGTAIATVSLLCGAAAAWCSGGRSSADAGSWNAAYRAVYRLDFTGLRRTGTYRITVRAGAATAVSPPFAVAPAATLYHRRVLNGVRHFTSEQDGAAVRPAVLDRQPANLTDR